MTDLILDVAVVLLPTLFAVAIEAASNKIKESRYWRFGVRAFGIGISVLTLFQVFRADRRAEQDRRKAVEETSQRVSASVSESVTKAVTKQYQEMIADQTRQIGDLKAQLAAQGKNVDRVASSQSTQLEKEEELLKLPLSQMPCGQLANHAGELSARMRALQRIYVKLDTDIDNKFYNAKTAGGGTAARRVELDRQESQEREQLRISREKDVLQVVVLADKARREMLARLDSLYKSAEDDARARWFECVSTPAPRSDCSREIDVMWQINANADYLDQLRKRMLSSCEE